MPKKKPEEVRERVVELRKAGRTYTQIEAQMAKEGEPLARPTLIKVLREAGLTRGGAPSPAPATARATNPSSGIGTTGRPSLRAQSEAGEDELMPKASPSKPKSPGPIEFSCDGCGAEFVADSEDDVPDKCPECGA